MKASRIWSLSVILISAVVVLIPWQLFPVCGIDGFVWPPLMTQGAHKCHATLKAVTITGIAGIVIGLVRLVIPGRIIAISSAVLTVAAGMLTFLFPVAITGVCRISSMPCAYGTRPALMISGVVLALTGIMGFFIIREPE